MVVASLGVPEVWCYDEGKLTLYLLQDGEYQQAERNLVFPSLPIQQLPDLIEKRRLAGRRAIRRALRAWVQQQH